MFAFGTPYQHRKPLFGCHRGSGTLDDLCLPPLPPEPDETQVTLKFEVLPESLNADVCALRAPVLVTMST